MFDIGFWELLIIGIVSLLVLGPERMPGAIRSTLKTVKDIKNVANGFKQEVSHQLKIDELHDHLKQAEQAGMSQIGDDVKRSVDELKAAAASVQEPYKNHNSIAPIAHTSSDKSTDPVKAGVKDDISDKGDNDAASK